MINKYLLSEAIDFFTWDNNFNPYDYIDIKDIPIVLADMVDSEIPKNSIVVSDLKKSCGKNDIDLIKFSDNLDLEIHIKDLTEFLNETLNISMICKEYESLEFSQVIDEIKNLYRLLERVKNN